MFLLIRNASEEAIPPIKKNEKKNKGGENKNKNKSKKKNKIKSIIPEKSKTYLENLYFQKNNFLI